jgi:hypothetical protein
MLPVLTVDSHQRSEEIASAQKKARQRQTPKANVAQTTNSPVIVKEES